MSSDLDFHLFCPKGALSDLVQGIWSVSCPAEADELHAWLHSDAASGLLINLGAPLGYDEQEVPAGVYLLPVNKQTTRVTLPPGAQAVGVRFLPGAGRAWMMERFAFEQGREAITPLTSHAELMALAASLRECRGHRQRLSLTYRWLRANQTLNQPLPRVINEVLQALDRPDADMTAFDNGAMSQRQIERYFRRYLEMTPKYYQRLMRAKQTLLALKLSPLAPLADIALALGFADQAHMTRELKQLIKITPKRYRQCLTQDAG
ncbi:helix-turn-helix domain-containing protein [Shewanella sp. KCT]|uniref:helix-turn-helix domain-containing protein n=1 Tax=Shewanella sp. KCT TaxID=2569535 RepID=UPI00118459AD|nr:helix-turn-helix domain-containing protein [Shewanella sp. KCT]TVP15049.1 hypothetical protein AYI87_05005 [Shewanella sp. KCT]